MSARINNRFQSASDRLCQDDPTPSFPQPENYEAQCGNASNTSPILASLHRWGPSLALLAIGFINTPPDVLNSSVGGGVSH